MSPADQPFRVVSDDDIDPRWAVLAAVLLLTTVLTFRAGVEARALRQPPATAQAELRSALVAYQAATGRGPTSLGELVASGLLTRIPPDPTTGRSDTWRLIWTNLGSRLAKEASSEGSPEAPGERWIADVAPGSEPVAATSS